MAKEKRPYSDTEREFYEAEKRLGDRLIEKLAAKRDTFGRADDPDLLQMSKCFSEHATENRDLIQRNGHLQRAQHSLDGRAARAAAQIARAASARAKIAAEAVSALQSLLPAAKAQAKKGKPALLRMILRASR